MTDMDKINPEHYKTGGIETIDYIQAKLTIEQFKGYLVGNVVKYLSRFEHKGGEEDLQKARWYLNRMLEERDRGRPVVYVCSPLRGDVERNMKRAAGYCRFVYGRGAIPLASHLLFPPFLDDGIREERAAGMEMALELLAKCDELWAFGGKVTEGMAAEIAEAEKLGVRVKHFDDRCRSREVASGDVERR